MHQIVHVVQLCRPQLVTFAVEVQIFVELNECVVVDHRLPQRFIALCEGLSQDWLVVLCYRRLFELGLELLNLKFVVLEF